MSEQRRTIRNRTFLPARIEIAELGLAVACTIRDLSESGARIQLSGSVPLPPSFTLYIPRFDRRVRVTKAWQRDDTIGVSFEVEAAIASATDPVPTDHRYVKKLEDEIARMRRLLESIREDPMKARLLLDRSRLSRKPLSPPLQAKAGIEGGRFRGHRDRPARAEQAAKASRRGRRIGCRALGVGCPRAPRRGANRRLRP